MIRSLFRVIFEFLKENLIYVATIKFVPISYSHLDCKKLFLKTRIPTLTVQSFRVIVTSCECMYVVISCDSLSGGNMTQC